MSKNNKFKPIGWYRFIRPILFMLEPEASHKISMSLAKIANSSILTRFILRQCAPIDNTYRFLGKLNKNRIGIGAGFDKNGLYLNELDALGFGSIEIGTVTPEPQDGNSLPRIFRSKDSQLLNKMGFPNDGAAIVSQRIIEYKENFKKKRINATRPMIGVNISKNESSKNVKAINWDFLSCFMAFDGIADYIVLNISSPNSKGLRHLQTPENLEGIMSGIATAKSQSRFNTPIFVKLSPDDSYDRKKLLEKISELDIAGVILFNSENALGIGNSGVSLRDNTLEMIKITKKEFPDLKIIASGGIGLDNDLELFTNAGADLIQIWTSFVYRGPEILKKL